MKNEQKAALYDDYVNQGSLLEKNNSKLKSEYAGNIPPNIQKQIDENQRKIDSLNVKLIELINS